MKKFFFLGFIAFLFICIIINLNSQNEKLHKTIIENVNKLNTLEQNLISKVQFLSSKSLQGSLVYNNQSQLSINGKMLVETSWNLPFLNYSQSSMKPLGFISTFKEKLIFFSGDGHSISINLSDIKTQDEPNNLKYNVLKNNLHDLIKDESFYKPGWISIKDTEVIKNDIYISYTNRINLAHNCYSLKILKAKVNFKKLIFKDHISLKECVDPDDVSNGEFTGHLVGGRIVEYKDNSILFSTGDFRARKFSNDKNSYLGKILKISSDGIIKIFSIGHRNPQGLFYDKNANIILSSEHGPAGGDELNLIEENNNYGWPISSYGEHYCKRKSEKTPYCKKLYELYPMYKSHSKYGFIEPLTYFVPSIAASELIKMSEHFYTGKNYNILLSSLAGSAGKTFYSIELSNDYKDVISINKIPSEERVRDLKISPDGDKIFTVKEDSSLLTVIMNL